MSKRLYVGNLSFDTTADTLRHSFAEIGAVVSVEVITDRETGRSRGFGFVEMSSNEGAKTAIDRLNGSTVDGRALRVSEAEARRDRRA